MQPRRSARLQQSMESETNLSLVSAVAPSNPSPDSSGSRKNSRKHIRHRSNNTPPLEPTEPPEVESLSLKQTPPMETKKRKAEAPEDETMANRSI